MQAILKQIINDKTSAEALAVKTRKIAKNVIRKIPQISTKSEQSDNLKINEKFSKAAENYLISFLVYFD